MDRKGQLLTLDLLLALVPLTLVLAYSASAMTGVVNQVQSYAYTYDNQRAAIDAADLLLKHPGEPVNWDNQTVVGLGFASFDNNFVYNHILNQTKLTYFKNANASTAIQDALWNVTRGRNILVNISASDPSYNMRVMGYTDNTGKWTITTDDATIDSELASADNLYVVERITRILVGVSGGGGVVITPIWNYTGNDIIQSSPTIADIDCDGEKELIVGSNANISGGAGGVMAFEANGTKIWEYPSGKAYTSSPLVADLDGDCGLEVIIGESPCPGEGDCEPSNITAVDDDGSWMWSVTMLDSTWNSPLVADVDYDGQVEIVLGGMQGVQSTVPPYEASIYVINGNNGSIDYTLSTCTCADSAQPALCAAEVGIPCDDKSRNKGGQLIADLDGNPTNGLEIVGNTCDEYIFAFHAGNPSAGTSPSLYWSYGPTGKHFHSGPAAGDINNDGNLEVIGNDRANMYVFWGNGTLMWTQPSTDDKSSPAIADLDGSNDGNLEIVVGGQDGIVRAFYNNGTSFWTYDMTGLSAADDDEIQSSPAIADINDDCVLDVVFGTGKDNKGAVSNTPSFLLGLSGDDGSLILQENATGAIISSPAIDDIDGDGENEIAVGSDGGQFYAFDVTGYGDGWSSFHQAEASMTPTAVWRTGEWTGNICSSPGLFGGAYSIIEQRARITATVKIYVW